MAKKKNKKPKPYGKSVMIDLLDQPHGLEFRAKFLPHGTYDHGSMAHQYGRLLLAELHKALKAHGNKLEYETNIPPNIDSAEQFPDPRIESPQAPSIIIPPGVRMH